MKSSTSVRNFRISLSLFIVGLVLSGVTAFPLLSELQYVDSLFANGAALSNLQGTALAAWIHQVAVGLSETYALYPWMGYGTDWLAFGHIVIALFFIGPLVDPTSCRWNLYAGIIACILVLPLAFICGTIRGIPFFWQILDCSFGILGILPLVYCLKLSRTIQTDSLHISHKKT